MFATETMEFLKSGNRINDQLGMGNACLQTKIIHPYND